LFYGEYLHTIDRKDRLIMPAKFRDACKDYGVERFFLTRGLDRCVFMFAEDEWRAQEQKFKSMPFTKQEARGFNRLFFSGAVDVRPDRQGRFILPSYLKDYAQIERDTVVLGVSNRIEIWDARLWQEFYANSSATFEKIAENILEL
jgi:MraZ protein